MLDDKLYLSKIDNIYNFTYNDVDQFGLDANTGHIGLPTISPLAKIYLLSSSISEELIRFAYSDTNFTSICVNELGELTFTNKIVCFAGTDLKAGGFQLQAGLLKAYTTPADAGSIEFDGLNMYYVDMLGNRQVFGIGGVTTVHSALSALQGGTPGQYYHLNLYQHTTISNLSAVSTNGIVRKNNNTFTASAVTWGEIINKPDLSLVIPPLTNNQNKYLTNDGVNLAWGVVNSTGGATNDPSQFRQESIASGTLTIDVTNRDQATTIEYILTARDNTSGDIKTCKMIVVSCKSDVFYTEYTQILSNDYNAVALYEFTFNAVTEDIELNATTLSDNTTIEGYKEILNNLERTFEFTFSPSSLDTVTLDYTPTDEATTIEYILLAKDTDTDDTKTCKLIVVNSNNDAFYTEYAQLLSDDNLPIAEFDAVFNSDLQRIELQVTPFSENIVIEGFKEILN